ncbi:exo-alpha-sialidase [Bacillus thuringiensis]|uniref:exo-alpha-sialidase n=1 Tax=Bacillus thuringiensis TaxID=1428 RepID=UPI00211DA348|nr:exo-alpha-sialidase [Bacillus thuringiensis]
MYCEDEYSVYKKKDIKNLKIRLENLQFQLQQQLQQQKQFQAQLQRQEQNQAQVQNDTDTISNVGNPTINVNVASNPDHKKDRERHHKKQDDCCSSHKKDVVRCNPKNTEKQVNNPADDIINFPRITQSETSLAHFKDFILYGFNDSNDYRGGLGSQSFSGFAFSNNLGKTWTDGGSLPVNPGGTNEGDPVIAVDRNGVFYYGQVGGEVIGGRLEGVITVSTGTISASKTITMNRPQIVGRGQNPARSNPGDQDKEWITVGPDANNPGNEALYIVWTDFTAPTNPNIRFSKFRTGVNLTPIIQNQNIVVGNTVRVTGSYVLVDKRGIIYVFYEETTGGFAGFQTLGQPNRTIRMVKSIDGGNTFPINVAVSAPFAAAATTTSPCNRPSIGVDNSRQIRMNEFPQAAVGPDGTIYVVWNAGRVVGNTTFIDTFLAYSQNEGVSWTQINVTNNIAYSFFPSVAVNNKGAHIQYNRFNDPNNVGGLGDGTFGIFMKSFSLKTGLSKECMVSTQFSPIPVTNPNPDAAQCYMGDYNQVISGPGDCLLHAWGDNRNRLNGRDNPDVYFALTTSKKEHNCCCDKKEDI